MSTPRPPRPTASAPASRSASTRPARPVAAPPRGAARRDRAAQRALAKQDQRAQAAARRERAEQERRADVAARRAPARPDERAQAATRRTPVDPAQGARARRAQAEPARASAPSPAVRRSAGATVTATGPRLVAKARAERKERRRRVRRRLGRGVLVLLPLAGLAWVLFASPLLAVDRVDVQGLGRLTAAQVQAAAAVPAGRPLARVDTDAIARRVRQLSPVAEVAVHRSWPSTLEIDVVERTALAGVVAPSGVQLLDPAGVVFATVPSLPTDVVRLQVNDPGPGDPATRAALEVTRALPPALRQKVRIVRAQSASAVVLLLADGRQVLWGSPGDTDDKAAAALGLLRMDAQVFDVSSPGVAVTR